MLETPGLGTVVVFGLATYAITSIIRYADAGAPFRALGAWAWGLSGWYRWALLPAMAAHRCTICTATWVAAALAATARPELFYGVILGAGAIGASTLLDVAYAALDANRPAVLRPELRLNALLNAQRAAPPPPPPTSP